MSVKDFNAAASLERVRTWWFSAQTFLIRTFAHCLKFRLMHCVNNKTGNSEDTVSRPWRKRKRLQEYCATICDGVSEDDRRVLILRYEHGHTLHQRFQRTSFPTKKCLPLQVCSVRCWAGPRRSLLHARRRNRSWCNQGGKHHRYRFHLLGRAIRVLEECRNWICWGLLIVYAVQEEIRLRSTVQCRGSIVWAIFSVTSCSDLQYGFHTAAQSKA